MKYLIILFCVSSLLFSAVSSAKSPPPPNPEELDAANAPKHEEALRRVEVIWVNPSDYSDIRPSNQSRRRFKERTFQDLESHLEKLARRLPEGQRLKLSVTNLDLAGQVWPAHMAGLGFGSDVRLIERVDIPRMNFNYELLDSTGNVIKAGEEKLKDMAFQERAAARYRNETLYYEKTMIKDWFVDNFELTEIE